MLYGDIQKVFVQVRIREAGTNAIRFHWIESLEFKKIKVLRFTKLSFGLIQSPFILEGTLKSHFENFRREFEEETINKI